MVASSGVSSSCSAVVLIFASVKKKPPARSLAVLGDSGECGLGSIPPPAGGKAEKIVREEMAALHHTRFNQNPPSLASAAVKASPQHDLGAAEQREAPSAGLVGHHGVPDLGIAAPVHRGRLARERALEQRAEKVRLELHRREPL